MTPLQEVYRVADIPLRLQAQLECCPLTVEQILTLDEGSLLRTERAAGDSIDVRIGGQLFGEGEVIVIENTIRVRISEFRETI
ncbi:MAG: FliM/FliN family flagellar motor switch protein [Bryobacteraceae bacterium]